MMQWWVVWPGAIKGQCRIFPSPLLLFPCHSLVGEDGDDHDDEYDHDHDGDDGDDANNDDKNPSFEYYLK